MPRNGSRANAITNSPIVRSLIKPVMSVIQPVASPSKTTTAENESDKYMIPTQPVAITEEEERPRKKAKKEEVITRYTADNLPVELKKYWRQRHKLFSKYDQGIEMDIEGWYSVTPEKVAQQIAERCSCGTIVDAFCGVGGNAIQFAMTCDKVIAIDHDPVRLECARKNAQLYGVADRIEFVEADFVAWAERHAREMRSGTVEDDVDVVFLSPPWGGIDYAAPAAASDDDEEEQQHYYYTLDKLAPKPGHELFRLARAITPDVALYLPRNTDVEQVARLPRCAPLSPTRGGEEEEEEEEQVEIEEAWTAGRLKAITCYFGSLNILASASTAVGE